MKKLRGVKRRIDALEKWPEDFCSWFPEVVDRGYWNCKIPVLDRLVSQKTSDQGIKTRAGNALLKAGENIRNARSTQAAGSIVAILITYPDMFNSEVCVFF